MNDQTTILQLVVVVVVMRFAEEEKA